MLSGTTFAFAAPKDVLGTEFEEAVTSMAALGIIDGFPDGTYRANESVTRAQMSKILMIAMGYKEIAENLQSRFMDVQGHWAESYISLADDLGIIKGYPDGTFKPDNKVSFNEAVTMSMRALGYVDEGFKGSWPTNYLLKAYDIELLDGVNIDAGYADRGNIAKLVFNSLYKEYVEYDNNGSFIVNSAGDKLIQRLVDTEEILLEYDDVFGEDKLDTIVDLDDYVFQKVLVYKNKNDQIIYVEKSLSNVLMGRINSTSTDSNVEIEVEGSNEYEDIPLDENVRIIYNGFYDGLDNHQGIESGGEIDIIWQDYNDNGKINDGEVDGVIVSKLDNKFVVTQEFDDRTFEIKGRKSYALSAYETVIIPTIEDDNDKEVVDEESLIITGDASILEDIKEKDVLYVYASRDGKKVKLYDVRETVTGTIQEIIKDDRVIINDESIKLTDYFRPYYQNYADRWAVEPESTQDKFLPGAEVVLILDNVGYIYSYYLLQEADGAEVLGLVIATKDGSLTEDDEGFVGDEYNVTLPILQLLGEDGDIHTLDVEQESEYVVLGTPVYDPIEGTTETALEIDLSKKDIIEYKLSEEGKIQSITKVDLETNLSDADVNKKINSIDGKYLFNEDTIIFSAIGNAIDWEVLDDDKIHDVITGIGLLDEDGLALDLLRIDEGLYETPVGDGTFAVIQSMSFVLGEDDEEVAKVRVYDRGVTKTYYTDADNSRLFIDLDNEFFELEFNDDNEIIGKKQVEERSDNVEHVFKLSRINSFYENKNLVSVNKLDEAFNESEKNFKLLSEDVVVYRLNYEDGVFQEITLGSTADLKEDRIIKGYDLNPDDEEIFDTVFVATDEDITFEDLPNFMVYDIVFEYGNGTEGDPYIIKTAEQLQSVSKYMSAYFMLMSDVDLESVEDWTPIGASDNRFAGYFDGNGYTINNLSVTSDSDYVGLFGWIENATVKDVMMTNVNLTGGEYSGALAGKASSSEISNCHVHGVVNGEKRVGGLMGEAFTSTIENSSADVEVNGTLSNSERLGGLIGNSNKSSISQSFAKGDVTGSDTGSPKVGGLVGYAYSTDVIENSYATGNVAGFKEIGGLVGYLYTNGIVTNSYSIGQVTGSDRVGGLVGYGVSSTTVTDSYWDTDASGTTVSSKGEGKTTLEMQDPTTFSTWSTAIWLLQSGSYPYLQWED